MHWAFRYARLVSYRKAGLIDISQNHQLLRISIKSLIKSYLYLVTSTGPTNSIRDRLPRVPEYPGRATIGRRSTISHVEWPLDVRIRYGHPKEKAHYLTTCEMLLLTRMDNGDIKRMGE